MILTRNQIRRVDKLAIDRYGIAGCVLMENAGRNAAELIRGVYGSDCSVFILCGPGNNGGDGCVIARHLHNSGARVSLLVTGEPARMSPDMLANFKIIQAMSLPLRVAPGWQDQHESVAAVGPDQVVIDALLGTGFTGEVRSPTSLLIEAVNSAAKRGVVAIDVPSGLDCDTGRPSNATIRADLTITFVATKTGLTKPEASSYVGRVEVADIGVPRELVVEIADEQ